MTSSTISPLRRVAAVAAIAGVTGLGAVALAPSALADPMKATTTPYTTVVDHSGHEWIVSPMPDKKIDVKIGKYKMKLYGWAAQAYQSLEANYDVQHGISIWFDEHAILQTGPAPCDPTRNAEDQPGCVLKHDVPRF
jgi:hypothetical protein